MPARTLLLATLVAVLALAATSSTWKTSCRGGTAPGVRAELVFGRNIGGAPGVSGQALKEFLDGEVTPRFPDGFTVLDANGQWRDGAAASIVREASLALVVIMRDDGEGTRRLQAVAEAYKQRFRQQSVLMVLSPTCYAF